MVEGELEKLWRVKEDRKYEYMYARDRLSYLITCLLFLLTYLSFHHSFVGQVQRAHYYVVRTFH